VNELPDHFEQSTRRHALLRHGQSLLVAVSGGVDSMVLLHLLHRLARRNSWRLTVAHLNHGLRGRSSDADERLVVRVAKKLGLAVVVERADVKQFAREQKLSIEMAARKLRHDFLARTALRLKIKTIALAHHADDQVELFFLRLLRGSGAEGLAGMKWRAVSPANSRVRLIRPLLDLSKSALRKFADEEKISFREDASNASLDFQRNRIRHELLPLLRKNYQPALDQTIARVMEIFGAEAELVGALAKRWLRPESPASAFRELPIALQRRVIQLQLQRQKVAMSFDLVENLRSCPDRLIKVSADLAVVLRNDGRVVLEKAAPIGSPSSAFCEITLNGRAGELVFNSVRLKWRTMARRSGKMPERKPGREMFDADKVGERIVLRLWRAGDRFQPIGMKLAVKLQDLFVNQKIPRAERHQLIVAETAGGEIFWVERIRIAERFKLSGQTNRCLQWQWKRA
jgi:tRNA(Ile)-lysidine synthase